MFKQIETKGKGQENSKQQVQNRAKTVIELMVRLFDEKLVQKGLESYYTNQELKQKTSFITWLEKNNTRLREQLINDLQKGALKIDNGDENSHLFVLSFWLGSKYLQDVARQKHLRDGTTTIFMPVIKFVASGYPKHFLGYSPTKKTIEIEKEFYKDFEQTLQKLGNVKELLVVVGINGGIHETTHVVLFNPRHSTEKLWNRFVIETGNLVMNDYILPIKEESVVYPYMFNFSTRSYRIFELAREHPRADIRDSAVEFLIFKEYGIFVFGPWLEKYLDKIKLDDLIYEKRNVYDYYPTSQLYLWNFYDLMVKAATTENLRTLTEEFLVGVIDKKDPQYKEVFQKLLTVFEWMRKELWHKNPTLVPAMKEHIFVGHEDALKDKVIFSFCRAFLKDFAQKMNQVFGEPKKIDIPKGFVHIKPTKRYG